MNNQKAVNKYRKKNPEKVRAHSNLNSAVKRGKVIPTPCEVCGNKEVQAHHHDYSKPKDVIWLCRKHHAKLHKVKKQIDHELDLDIVQTMALERISEFTDISIATDLFFNEQKETTWVK